MEIKDFSMDYWEDFSNFIEVNWKKNHPILDKKLFNWQYTGFGSHKGIQNSKVLLVDGEFCGFRGIIPGVYQYKVQGEQIIENGGSLAMWMIHPKVRGKGYGSKLLESTEAQYNTLLSAGINVNTAVPIYLKNKFSYLKKLNRYVVPINAEGYTKLLNTSVSYSKIVDWLDDDSKKNVLTQYPVCGNPEKFEELWKYSIRDENFFGLYRGSDFWKWRYMDSPYFNYLFFGNPEKEGLIVARVEYASSEIEDVNNLKILRIIEVIPFDREVWLGNNLEKMSSLLKGVLKWAEEEGCCAADFQISNNKLETLLLKVGFCLQHEDNKGTDIAGVFSPLIRNPTPINALWKIKSLGQGEYQNQNDVYIVKSDNDMDRPVNN